MSYTGTPYALTNLGPGACGPVMCDPDSLQRRGTFYQLRTIYGPRGVYWIGYAEVENGPCSILILDAPERVAMALAGSSYAARDIITRLAEETILRLLMITGERKLLTVGTSGPILPEELR